VTERLRYRALLHALWSLTGPVDGEIPPTERDVRYRSSSGGEVRGIAPRYDVFLPKAPSGHSAVLVHGGGFVIGSKSMKPMRVLASRLVAANIAVCSIDYRMLFRGGRLKEALEDTTAALAHWKERAPTYGLDPGRISAIGLSAGATLTLLAASQLDMHRVVSCFGLYELDHLSGPLAAALPRLLFGSSDRALWASRSPRGAAQTNAPTLLLHGTADGLVPHGQAERLAAHREALGLPTRLVIYPDAPHGFFNQDSEVRTKATEEIIAHLVR
jgi:acetyl esterase/lipase